MNEDEKTMLRDAVVAIVKSIGSLNDSVKGLKEEKESKSVQDLKWFLEDGIIKIKGEKGDKGDTPVVGIHFDAPKDGKQGDKGDSGISILGAKLSGKGELLIETSDGKEHNVGVVVGKDAEPLSELVLTEHILKILKPREKEIENAVYDRLVGKIPKAQSKLTSKEMVSMLSGLPKGSRLSYNDLDDAPDVEKIAYDTFVRNRHALVFGGQGASSSTSGGGTWGSITGTLSSQTDLQNALNAKLDASLAPTFQINGNPASSNTFLNFVQGGSNMTINDLGGGIIEFSAITGAGGSLNTLQYNNAGLIGGVSQSYSDGDDTWYNSARLWYTTDISDRSRAGTFDTSLLSTTRIYLMPDNNGTLALIGGINNVSEFINDAGYLDSSTSAGGELSGTYPNPTLLNSAVIGKVLTGLNVIGSSITSSDTILDAFGKIQNQINGVLGGAIYQGTWNASTNTPTLADGSGTKGYYYVVSVAGTRNLGSGSIDFQVGDWAIYNGTIWQKVDNTDAVSSVNGFIGAVNLTTANISEVTNLYYTDARARASITGTTNRITVTTGVVDISASYVGQSSITTLGTITTGVWTGTTIAVANGGTGLTTLGGTNRILYTSTADNITSSANFTYDGANTFRYGSGVTGLIFQPNTSSSTFAGVYSTNVTPSNTNHFLRHNGVTTVINATSAGNLQLQSDNNSIFTVGSASIVGVKLMTLADTVAGNVLTVTNSSTSASLNGASIVTANNGFTAGFGVLNLNNTNASASSILTYIAIQKNNINADTTQEHNITYSLRDNSSSRQAGTIAFKYFDTGSGTQTTGWVWRNLVGGTTLTDSMRLSGNRLFVGGSTAPTAIIHLLAGTTTASTSPLKFTATSAVLLGTAEQGSVEVSSEGQLFYSPLASQRNFVAVWGYVAKTANYTALVTDYTIDCTTNTFTVTLPTAGASVTGVPAGRVYKVINSGTGVITIATTGGQTINGSATQTISTQYSGMTLQSTGAGWIITSRF